MGPAAEVARKRSADRSGGLRSPFVALAAAACGYSSTWPDYPDWLIDTAPSTFTVPCVAPGGQPVALTIASTTSVPLTLATVAPPDQGCAEVPFTTIEPYQQLTVDVTDDLVWTARDEQQELVAVFQVPPGAGTWIQGVP